MKNLLTKTLFISLLLFAATPSGTQAGVFTGLRGNLKELKSKFGKQSKLAKFVECGAVAVIVVGYAGYSLILPKRLLAASTTAVAASTTKVATEAAVAIAFSNPKEIVSHFRARLNMETMKVSS